MAKFRVDKNCKIWAFWDQAFKGTFRGPIMTLSTTFSTSLHQPLSVRYHSGVHYYDL